MVVPQYEAHEQTMQVEQLWLLKPWVLAHGKRLGYELAQKVQDCVMKATQADPI